MTVVAQDLISGPFAPNGVTTSFPFDFPVLSASEVSVFSRLGAFDTPITSGYSVTGLGGSGGAIVFSLAPSADLGQIWIVGAPSFEQDIAFGNQGPFLPSTVNEANDRAALRDLWLRDGLHRAFQVAPGEVVAPLPNAAARASKVAFWDVAGNLTAQSVTFTVGTSVKFATLALATAATIAPGIAFVETAGLLSAGDGGGGLYIPAAPGAGVGKFQSTDGQWWKFAGGVTTTQFATLALAQAANISAGTVFIRIAGYYAAGDGGGALYVPGAAGAGAGKFQSADGQWWIIAEQVGNIRMFGAKIDGVTADTTAWNNAIAWSTTTNGEIYHPGGVSIYVGNMLLKKHRIRGVDSYYAPNGSPITQTSVVEFHGNGSGIALADANSGSIYLEKIGFRGVPGTYSNQIGFNMSDTLRPGGQNEGWPTFRDVSFGFFNSGVVVGQTYQGGWMFNVYIHDCTNIGYWNQSTDWYHIELSCGSSGSPATTQLFLGPATPNGIAAGNHQFFGGAFFGAINSIIIENSNGNLIDGASIQNAQNYGLIIGDGTHGCSDNLIVHNFFSGNNQAGGNRNAGGSGAYDVWLRNFANANRILDNRFADASGATTCVAGGVTFEGPNATGCIVSRNHFCMDNIVTPGAPSAPVAISIPSVMKVNGLDQLDIEGNTASYGEFGIYPFQIARIDLSAVANPYAVASSIAMKPREAYLSAGVGHFLADPQRAGRRMLIAGANGTYFNCNTAGALGGGHKTGTFTAAGYIDMISTSATTWLVLTSSNCTLS